MSVLEQPVKLLIISALIYFLSACESTPPPPPEEGSASVSFTVDCVQLVCTVDASLTISGSDDLDSLLCDMGDGNQVDLLTLEVIYDYTYAAPGIYDITCSAQSTESKTDSDTVTKNVDGVLVNAGVDQTVSSSTIVTLDGSLSEDTTGNPINLYRWVNMETNIPALNIVNSDTVAPTFFAPEESNTKTYRVRLTVSIDNGANFSESSDIVEITVIPAGMSDL